MQDDKGETHSEINLEVEEPDAEQEADDDADARGKVLGDVVGVIDAERRQDAADGLEHDRGPDNPIVALEEAVAGDILAILEDDTSKRGEERVEGQLNVARPDSGGSGRVLEHLLKVHACES